MTTPASLDHPVTTRERLMAAAFRVVAKEGLEAASVKAIAADAGLTPGLLHYHFPSKAALLEAVLRDALARYLDASHRRRAVTAAQEQIATYFQWARQTLTDEQSFFKVRLAFASAALTNPDMAAVQRELNAAAAHDVALTLAASRASTAPSPREVEIGAMLKALTDGVMLAWLNDPAFPIQQAITDVEQSIPIWTG